jgi:hypothetical protein
MPGLVAKYLGRFTDGIARAVPVWRTNRPGKDKGAKFEWALIKMFDFLHEWMIQGINAWGPGSPNATTTALPYIGRSRGLIQGEAESSSAYAARLRNWIGPPPFTDDIWSNMGSSELLALAIHDYLANAPVVKVFERIRGGTTATIVTANADGTTSKTTGAWNWDNGGHGFVDDVTVHPPSEVKDWTSDLWIVVYTCEWAVTGTIGATADPSHDSEAIGHLVNPTTADTILGLVAQYKGAHVWIRAIVWSYDVTEVDPAPDGTWGNFSKYVGGVQVPARSATCRYWIPSGGG